MSYPQVRGPATWVLHLPMALVSCITAEKAEPLGDGEPCGWLDPSPEGLIPV